MQNVSCDRNCVKRTQPHIESPKLISANDFKQQTKKNTHKLKKINYYYYYYDYYTTMTAQLNICVEYFVYWC